jgi:hypothetical protein
VPGRADWAQVGREGSEAVGRVEGSGRDREPDRAPGRGRDREPDRAPTCRRALGRSAPSRPTSSRPPIGHDPAPYPTACAAKRGCLAVGWSICSERPACTHPRRYRNGRAALQTVPNSTRDYGQSPRSAVAGASGVATASRTKRPTARVASHLDPLSAPGTGPQIRVVREGRDGSQSHPGMDVPIEEIHLHEVISANGHVVPPSRLPRVLLYPLEPPANQGHYPGSVQAGGCPRCCPTATSRPS